MSSPKWSLESKSTEIDQDGKNLLEFSAKHSFDCLICI